MPRVAILLCAGYGTRMGALTANTPKPLLPVAGKPILDYLLERLAELDGLEAVHVVSNSRYLERFSAWAEDRRPHLGPDLEVHDDGSTDNRNRRGAVGDLDFVLRRIEPPDAGFETVGSETVAAMVAAGDNILRFSLEPLWRALLERGETHVLGLRETDPELLRRTGVLELGPGGRVVRLHEKPADPPSTWACPSLYGFSAAALARVGPYLAAGHEKDEIGRFVAYLATREPVYAVTVRGERLHVGSPEAYRRADEILRQAAGYYEAACNKSPR